MIIEIGNVKRKKKIYAGDQLYPLVLASVGASQDSDSIEREVAKSVAAEKYGANIVIDHTLTPDNYVLQQKILENTDIPLSSIAVYDVAAAALYEKRETFSASDVLGAFEEKAKLGLDLITVHGGVRMENIRELRESGRIIPSTSRGGTMVIKNMQRTGEENYYYTYFEKLLEIAKKYSVTVSLGTTFRPATINDAINENGLYYMELKQNAELVLMAQSMGVGVMVEGIGHCPINLTPKIVKESIDICHGAPYRVLTVSTDCALGFDHVSSAISSAVAVQSGASFVTAVSRSEHLGLPEADDLKEAVTAAKIAVHSGYIARSGDISKDMEMARARESQGCRGSVSASIIPEVTREALLKEKRGDGTKKCGMCGPFCALDSLDDINRSR